MFPADFTVLSFCFLSCSQHNGLSMKIKNIGLAWIITSDFARAKQFYQKTLGLSLEDCVEEYSWMELKGEHDEGRLGIGGCAPEMPDKPGQNAVVTLTVDDVVAAKKELEGKGVTFLGDIMEVPGHVKMATFADFDGNKFQIVEILSKK